MADYTYYFEAEEFVINTSKEIVFCPKPERNTKLVLWLQDKNSDIAIEDRMYPQMPSGSLRKDNFYRPITQVMGSTSAEFINQLKLHPDACFRGFSYDQLERAGQKF